MSAVGPVGPARPSPAAPALPTAPRLPTAPPLLPEEPDDVLDLAEYRPGHAAVLPDRLRWPTLSPVGRARLAALREHPLAPAWTHATGDRLTAEGLNRAAVPLPVDDWLPGHLAVARALPFYRRRRGPLGDLSDFPTITREDLIADVSAFVPLDADLDQAVHGSSSGSTGHALTVPDHIEEVARGFHHLVALVRSLGADWRPDPSRAALVHTVHQRQAFTYASVLSGFDQAAMVRVNLHAAQWPGEPAGIPRRNAFLRALDPQVVTGNPTSLAQLLDPDLVAGLRPMALVSGALHLSAGLRADLTAAYGCPVIDQYGLHETRTIAISTDGGPHMVVDRRVHVEVLDPADRPVPPGSRGEIVVTAGENPLLPLVRYRTGDFGRLVEVAGRPAIADLEGRAAVVFTATDGSPVPGVDLTQYLQACGAHGWSVVQERDGAVAATIAAGDAGRATRALSALLGREVTVRRVPSLADLGEGKPRRYLRR